MGKTLDVLLGRKGFKTSKLKTLLGLSTTRLTVLKNQRRSRLSHAESDIAQLLLSGHREPALDRAEYVIKQKNMYDLFVMVEGYCKLLTQGASLLDHSKVCPEELREAISSLIYVSSRCGELPELQDVRSMFATRFGQAFVSAAVEVRNGCAVNDRIIQKASVKPADLETRLKLLKDIATEKAIPFDPETFSSSETASVIAEEEVVTNKSPSPFFGSPSTSSGASKNPSEYYWKENLEESMKDHKFKDASSAAQAAFESAAFAAAAARAVIDLSKSNSNGGGSSDSSTTMKQSEIRNVSELEDKGKIKIIPKKLQWQIDEESEEEDEELVRRRPKAMPLDVLGAKKGTIELREAADEYENGGGRLRFMASPAGSSFSVRTRAGVRM